MLPQTMTRMRLFLVITSLPAATAHAGPPPDVRGVYTGSGVEETIGCGSVEYIYSLPFSVSINIPGQTGGLLIGQRTLSGTISAPDESPLKGLAARDVASFHGSVSPSGGFQLQGESVVTAAGLSERQPFDDGVVTFESESAISASSFFIDPESGCQVRLQYTAQRTNGSRLRMGVQYSQLGDFDGDGNTDLVLRHPQSGNVVAWRLNGSSVLSSALIATANPIWELQGIGDLNGDGKSDLVWRHGTNGNVVAWLMNGTALLAGSAIPTTADVALQLQGLGDFDGDGRDDLLWRNKHTHQLSVWFMNGASVQSTGPVGTTLHSAFDVVGIGDINADGRDDIVTRQLDFFVWPILMDGLVVLGEGMLSEPSSPIVVNDSRWEIQGLADVNGDSKADIFWRKTTGEVGVSLLDGLAPPTSVVMTTISPTWRVQGVGDLNGDQNADIILRSGTIVNAWMMNGPAIVTGGRLATINPGWLIE